MARAHTLSSKRSLHDRESHSARSALRLAYEEVLLLSPEYACTRDVDALLWRACAYRPIEELRSRLRQADKVRVTSQAPPAHHELALLQCRWQQLGGAS